MKRIAVVGGGVAGLQVARAARKAGFTAVVFEKANEIGGVWRSNYDTSGIQVPKSLYEFPDFPAKYGDYASIEQVRSYVQQYAENHGLTDPSVLRLGTHVEAMSILEGNKGWNVRTKSLNGVTSEENFDYAVVSTGLYSMPYIPTVPGQEAFKGEILHSTEFTNAAKTCKDKNVIVVGGGKSAVDCAVAASTVGGAKSTTFLFRKAHWGTPRKIAGLIPFQYVFLSRFGQGLVSWYKGAWPTAPRSVHVAHSMLGVAVAPIFKIVEALFAFQLGQKRDYRPDEDLVSDFYNAAQVLDTNMKRSIESGKIISKKASITSFGPSEVMLSDGSKAQADVVVMATGFQRDYSKLFDAKTLNVLHPEKDGLWLYRSILPVDVPNLAFIGPEIATISNIATHGIQAEWLMKLLKGEVKLPARIDMVKDIEIHKQFSRKWMPVSNARSALVLLHQIHYHDRLLRDMNVPHRRKGANVLAELFMPYTPMDYADVVK